VSLVVLLPTRPAVFLYLQVLMLSRAFRFFAVNAHPREWASAGTWFIAALAAIPLRSFFGWCEYIKKRLSVVSFWVVDSGKNRVSVAEGAAKAGEPSG